MLDCCVEHIINSPCKPGEVINGWGWPNQLGWQKYITPVPGESLKLWSYSAFNRRVALGWCLSCVAAVEFANYQCQQITGLGFTAVWQGCVMWGAMASGFAGRVKETVTSSQHNYIYLESVWKNRGKFDWNTRVVCKNLCSIPKVESTVHEIAVSGLINKICKKISEV